jgi:tetratricopeptide (TPR) repeat protein
VIGIDTKQGHGSRRSRWRAKAAILSGMSFLLLAQVVAQVEPADEFRSLLERGFAMHQRADYAGALPLLERAWKLKPHDYFANLLVGIDLLRTDEPAESIAYLEEAARQRPKEDFPYEYLGEAQTHLRHYPEAAAAYERALTVAPTSPQAVESAAGYWVERFGELASQLRATPQGLAAEHRLQARSHAAQDPARLELLSRSSSLDPEAPGIWSELALGHLRTGNLTDAESNITRALERNPNDLGALEAQAVLAATHGDWTKVLRSLDAIGNASPGVLARVAADWPENLQPPATAAVGPRTSAFFRCTGSPNRRCTAESLASAAPVPHTRRSVPVAVLYRKQRWESLLAAPIPPAGDAEGWLRRGVALAELGQCANAIPALERAAGGTTGQDIYVKFLLSWCYAKDAGRVMQDLQQEAGENPALAHMVRGDVLLRIQANSAGAAVEYSVALRAHPDDPELSERLAEAQFESGQFAQATANANSALRIDPYRFSAMETLARIAIEQRSYADAVPYLEKMVAHDPKDASAQVELGTALAQTGNPAEAAQLLLPALAAGYPDEKGSLHAALGAALRKLGRSTEASQAFAQARELSEAYQRNAHRGGDDAK